MTYQLTDYSCASASCYMALDALGVHCTHELVHSCLFPPGSETINKEGADEQDIIALLNRFGIFYKILHTTDYAEALRWLRSSPNPSILCVDNYEHWVSLIGGCQHKLWVMDPSWDADNISRLGRKLLTPWQILSWWGSCAEGDPPTYYAIELT